jgi:hypothetical protein
MYLPYHEPDAQQMYCTCKLIVSFETSVLNTLVLRDNRFNDHLILRLSTLRSRSTLVSVTAGQRKEITVELRRKGRRRRGQKRKFLLRVNRLLYDML